jgi:hypothetical protein
MKLIMTKETLQPLIDQGKSTYDIAKELKCSQTNIRYWLRKYGLNTTFVSNSKFCAKCNAALTGKKTKYCSKKCSGVAHSTNPNNYLMQQERAFKRKKKLIDVKGGKCEMCGYCRNYAALCFHHKDPADKLFTLDSRKCSNTNMKSLEIEASKCLLLCNNCHMELHHPNLKMVPPTGLEPVTFGL